MTTMTRHLFFPCLLLVVSFLPALAGAQEVAGLPEARAVSQCVHQQDEQMQRLMRLIEQAEQRAARPGVAADVRRDALASIEALVDRIRSHAQQARLCVEESQIPVRVDGVVVETAPADPAQDSLAAEHGTVPVIERDTALAARVTVVRGERVDGTGSAPDASVRDAVRTAAPRIVACHDEYLDRAARRSGDVHLSFTAIAGGRVTSAEVERGGPFDAAMSQCLQRAATAMTIAGQRGRSVYSYVLRFAAE